jgi:hypothetical protein
MAKCPKQQVNKEGCNGLASRNKHQNNNGHFPSPPCSEQEHGIQYNK